MNLSYIDNKILIHMNNTIDLENKDNIKNYFKNIFLKLKEYLNIELSGYYVVKIYKDINGIIIEIMEEDTDYYIYEGIDMKIVIEDVKFMYEIEDIFINKNILNKSHILKYNNKLYLYFVKHLDDIEIGYLNEISKLIYQNTENIIKYGRELPLNLI